MSADKEKMADMMDELLKLVDERSNTGVSERKKTVENVKQNGGLADFGDVVDCAIEYLSVNKHLFPSLMDACDGNERLVAELCRDHMVELYKKGLSLEMNVALQHLNKLAWRHTMGMELDPDKLEQMIMDGEIAIKVDR